LKTHKKFFFTTTEVRSKHANSHLGDVFNDGPKPGYLMMDQNRVVSDIVSILLLWNLFLKNKWYNVVMGLIFFFLIKNRNRKHITLKLTLISMGIR